MVAAAQRRGLPWSFTGLVDDVRPHAATGDACVIPLHVGSGTRLKAYEAMAMGLPVVATSIGVEGLPLTPGEHYLRADTPGEFAAAVLRLLADAMARRKLAATAHEFVEAGFSSKSVARVFERICSAAMQAKR
jgi:glycosyltransferase involved in cell wall biosynthesis